MLLVFVGATGCTGLCQGPACESSYSGGRLSRVDVSGDGQTDIVADASVVWTGDLEAGSGWSTAVLDGYLLVGQPEPARVQVFTPDLVWLAEVAAASDEFGATVTVHRRGAAHDVWVGAPGHDRGRGALFVYRDVLATGAPEFGDPAVVLEGGVAFDRLGQTVVRCPDLTGDGVGELALGVPQLEPGSTWPHGDLPMLAGAVFMVTSESLAGASGSHAPWALGRAWWGADVGHGAGTALACDAAGVYVGAPWRAEDPPAEDPNAARGAVYVLEGLPDSGPLEEVATQRIDGRAADEWFGQSLAVVGGYSTRHLLVGSPGHRGGAGRVALFALGDAGTATVVTDIGPDPTHSVPDHFGRSVFAGDVDGDGQEDLLLGSPDYRVDGASHDVGRLWVFRAVSGWPEALTADQADHTVIGAQAFLRIGRAVHPGDVDGDALDELWLPSRAVTPTL